jgi:hypothetical protein
VLPNGQSFQTVKSFLIHRAALSLPREEIQSILRLLFANAACWPCAKPHCPFNSGSTFQVQKADSLVAQTAIEIWRAIWQVFSPFLALILNARKRNTEDPKMRIF